MRKSHDTRPGGTPADQGRSGGSATAGGTTAATANVAGAPVAGAGAGKPKSKSLFAAVRHDHRGNAVLQWASDTARHAVVSTSSLLKRLDVSSLSLEDTLDEKKRRAEGQPSFSMPAAPLKARTTAAGAVPVKPAAAKAAAAAAAKRTGATAPRPGTRPAARSSWWRRLFERR